MTVSGSDPVAIRVEHVSKRYIVGHASSGDPLASFREQLGRQVRSLWRNVVAIGSGGRGMLPGERVEEFWALRDVSFDVHRGEVLGVIGLNGAGKSTLLKILGRITEPTSGRVTITGRVATLLEVGTGFHPELTGRENIYLNGSILGMKRREIDARFDEIVDFAEVERFLDTPVKRYSSGMYVRLAFAVAAHLQPEILLLDEVLAVGDVVFQKKCLGKMQAVARSGRTVLLVSHNLQTVATLTDRTLLLEGGRLSALGPSDDVVARYLAAQNTAAATYEKTPIGDRPEITRVELQLSGPGHVQQFGRSMTVDISLYTPEAVPNAAISFQVLTEMHQPVLHVLNLDTEVPMLREPGMHRLRCRLPHLRLYPGRYYLKFFLGASHPRRVFEGIERACPFEVVLLDRVREFYWYPGGALYVEDVIWTAAVESRLEAGTAICVESGVRPV